MWTKCPNSIQTTLHRYQVPPGPNPTEIAANGALCVIKNVGLLHVCRRLHLKILPVQDSSQAYCRVRTSNSPTRWNYATWTSQSKCIKLMTSSGYIPLHGSKIIIVSTMGHLSQVKLKVSIHLSCAIRNDMFSFVPQRVHSLYPYIYVLRSRTLKWERRLVPNAISYLLRLTKVFRSAIVMAGGKWKALLSFPPSRHSLRKQVRKSRRKIPVRLSKLLYLARAAAGVMPLLSLAFHWSLNK